MNTNDFRLSRKSRVDCRHSSCYCLHALIVALLFLCSCSYTYEQGDIVDLTVVSNPVGIRNGATYVGYNGNESISYQINLLFSNDTVFVSKNRIDYSSGHFQGNLVNLTAQSMIGDSLLLLNTDKFWFIPFSEGSSYAVSGGGKWEFKCGCGGHLQPANGCEIKTSIDDSKITFCHKPPDIECQTVCIGWQIFRPTGGGQVVCPYGGVLVRAESLIEL